MGHNIAGYVGGKSAIDLLTTSFLNLAMVRLDMLSGIDVSAFKYSQEPFNVLPDILPVDVMGCNSSKPYKKPPLEESFLFDSSKNSAALIFSREILGFNEKYSTIIVNEEASPLSAVHLESLFSESVSATHIANKAGDIAYKCEKTLKNCSDKNRPFLNEKISLLTKIENFFQYENISKGGGRDRSKYSFSDSTRAVESVMVDITKLMGYNYTDFYDPQGNIVSSDPDNQLDRYAMGYMDEAIDKRTFSYNAIKVSSSILSDLSKAGVFLGKVHIDFEKPNRFYDTVESSYIEPCLVIPQTKPKRPNDNNDPSEIKNYILRKCSDGDLKTLIEELFQRNSSLLASFGVESVRGGSNDKYENYILSYIVEKDIEELEFDISSYSQQKIQELIKRPISDAQFLEERDAFIAKFNYIECDNSESIAVALGYIKKLGLINQQDIENELKESYPELNEKILILLAEDSVKQKIESIEGSEVTIETISQLEKEFPRKRALGQKNELKITLSPEYEAAVAKNKAERGHVRSDYIFLMDEPQSATNDFKGTVL